MDASPFFIVVEALEARRLRAAVYPTDAEQYAVELINRARANPTAEAARYTNYQDKQGNTFDGDLNEGLAAGTITAAAKQPLAINLTLTRAARDHAAYMISSSTFSHTGASGSTPEQREAAAGYVFGKHADWGENIAINWSSSALNVNDTVKDQHDSLFTDQTETDRGHRTNMMDPTRNEIGVGVAGGLYNYPGYGELNAVASSHDTASNGTLFLTGVAYADTVKVDHFYTPGEGLGDIHVVARRTSDGRTFATDTWSSGGYSLALGSGTYDVTGYGTGLSNPITYPSVTITTENVKEDFVDGQATGVVPTNFAVLKGRNLVVTGTSGPDTIGITLSRDTQSYIAAMNGGTMWFPTTSVDVVDVLAGDGNDVVTINAGYLSSYVEGGAGKDALIGGAGQDTLYGNGGIDRLLGNAGEDVLVGENGNDLIYGGLGNDRIYGGVGNDTVDAGSGNDRVYGGAGNDLLLGGPGHDILHGESGADTLNGGPHSDYGDDDPLDTRISIELFG